MTPILILKHEATMLLYELQIVGRVLIKIRFVELDCDILSNGFIRFKADKSRLLYSSIQAGIVFLCAVRIIIIPYVIIHLHSLRNRSSSYCYRLSIFIRLI